MTSRLAYVIAVVCLVLAGVLYMKSTSRTDKPAQSVVPPSPTSPPATPTSVPQARTRTSVFVPYWTEISDSDTFDGYDRIIYFGVGANANGIITTDKGYDQLASFVAHQVDGKEKWVTVRMLDADTNSAVLKNPAAWSKIGDGIVKLVQDNGLDGVVFDFELGVIPFQSITDDITAFYRQLYDTAKASNVPFAITMYGDVIARNRPFDIAKLSLVTNEMMVMAYDFHKSRGEPGPNFPLAGKEKYGYDMQLMADDFLKYISADKLTVVYGMYGYDWLVDEKQRPISAGKVLTLTQITDKFVTNCQLKNCVITRNDKAGENEVDYVDDYAGFHVVWYEDEESVRLKTDYLKTRGINGFGRWAWGYY